MKSRKPNTALVSAAALTLATSLLFSACAGSPTCEDYGNCPENGGSGGNAGGGKAGTSAKAGNSALSGAAGEVGGSGGEAGTGLVGAGGVSGAAGGSACNGDCSGVTPVCDAENDTCVECLERSDCEAPKSTCDTSTHTCVECAATTDCTDSAKPFCDQAAKCVACLKQADCADPAASACHAGACAACTVDSECSNIAGKGVCDAGTCVQCTGKKFAACGLDAGTPLVCDSLKRTCTTSKQSSAGLCHACVTDAQCAPGQMCVLDKFGTPAQDVGYFCHWKKGDPASSAPADCFATGQPYSGTQLNAISVDGAASDTCTLRTSTCVGLDQFGTKDCAAGTTANDALCGFSPAKDAKCAQIPASSSYRCTMTCLSDNDCPAPSTCNKGVSPFVCTFN